MAVVCLGFPLMFPFQEIYKTQIFYIIKSGFWEIENSEMYTIPLLSLAANSNETGGEEQSIVLVEDERNFDGIWKNVI